VTFIDVKDSPTNNISTVNWWL